MTEVAFYHLTRSSLEDALPLLLAKTLAAGKRGLVLAGERSRVEDLTSALWGEPKGTHAKGTWLPHGSVKDGRPEDQPIWLTETCENANEAQFLFLTYGVECSDIGAYERCFELFDGTSDSAVNVARSHWKSYADQGFELTYWQQTESGGWQKKDT